MLVSIILPNYNHADYLEERIQSVLNQSCKNLEIIILDDCSTDDSKKVIERYSDNKSVSHIIYNDKNSGSTFKQWEKGFELAKGDYIWIAESDDCCDKEFLKTLVNKLNSPDVVLAFTRSMQINEQGKELGVFATQKDLNENMRLDGADFIKYYLSKSNIVVNASSAIFRRKALMDIEMNFMEFKGCGDWLFWIYLAELGSVVYEPTPLNYFRQHSVNATKGLHLSGNNSKEVHKVYEYLCLGGYLSRIRKIRFRLVRLISYLSSSQFRDELILKDVLREWRFSWWEYVVVSPFVFYYRVLTKLFRC